MAMSAKPKESAVNKSLLSVDFEVFGKVQHVFFRKHTQKTANTLGLKGWCMNTSQETVIGQVQGPKQDVAEMKNWLETVGSPKSTIEKAIFKMEIPIAACDYKGFIIRK